MIKISSKDNFHIKELVRLNNAKSARKDSGKFVVEGERLVLEALSNNVKVEQLFFTSEALERIGGKIELDGLLEYYLIDDSLVKKIADTASPQGIFAICNGDVINYGLPDKAEFGALMLCSLQDPGNMGTILRSADAFGLSSVIFTSDCPYPFSPKVLRASMGASFRVALYCVDDAQKAIGDLKRSRLNVYASVASNEGKPISSFNLAKSVVLIGNEGSGLSDDVKAACGDLVTIPVSDKCESLNAAMAATVFAWEMSKKGGTYHE